MTTRSPRATAAGMKVERNTQRTELSIPGERKVDDARGASTGFAARGFSNGPNIQVCRVCAPSGATTATQSTKVESERAAAFPRIGMSSALE